MEGTGAAEEKEKEEKEEESPLKVSRRLIYLHRLVGDDPDKNQKQQSRKKPWHVTIVFVCYALCATIMILTYIQIDQLAGNNVALENMMKYTPWEWQAGKAKMFNDIVTTDNILSYMTYAVMPQLMLNTSSSIPSSLLSYNKVLNQPGFCQNTSVLLIAMRRMKTTTDSKKTTTDRFKALYPEAWTGSWIPAGSSPKSFDDTSDVWASYTFPDSYVDIPEDYIGWDAPEAKSSTKLTYADLNSSAGSRVWTKWEYTQPCDKDACATTSEFYRQGGYFAAIVIRSSAARDALNEAIQSSGIIDWSALNKVVADQWVYLLSDKGVPFIDGTYETCAPGRQLTNIMRFEDFRHSGFIDERTASVSLDTMVYNANKQAVTSILCKWDFVQPGVVIYPNDVHVTTIKLDLEDSYFVFWEVLFVIGTCVYFFELFIYKSYKYRIKLLYDVWTYVNAIATISSIISISLRIHHSKMNSDYLASSPDYRKLNRNMFLQDQMYFSTLYMGFSAIALLTIWVRVVELLSGTPPRVQLLEKTLVQALGSMFSYLAYISIIMVGFWAFAAVFFADASPAFVRPFKAFISIVELLCLNIKPLQNVAGTSTSLKNVFFILYMGFAIVSVQMFNSIINYAYNKVSEEMEPVFKKASRDKKRKDKTQKGFLERVCKMFKRACGWLRDRLGLSKTEIKEDPLKPVEENKAKPADILGSEDMLPADKEKLDGFKESQQKTQATESCFSFLMYAIFVVSYMVALTLALDIAAIGLTSTAVGDALAQTLVVTQDATQKHVHYSSVYNVSDIHQMTKWISSGLPQFIYDSDGPMGINPNFGMANTTQCIQNWNCFVTSAQESENVNSPQKIARITQRLQQRVPNNGLIKLSSGDKEAERFRSGPTIVPVRGPAFAMTPGGHNTGIEDTSTGMALSYGGVPFCERGSDGGFRDKGGIVCLLDADRFNMTSQLHTMVSSGFFSLATGTIVVDMVMYNANINGLVYVYIQFTVSPSGRVTVEERIQAFSLLKVQLAKPGSTVAAKVLNVIKNVFKPEFICIIIYMLMVFYFVGVMWNELKLEAHRKHWNDKTNLAVAVWEFFAHDVFHLLDVVSYIFSMCSLVFFVIWMALQLQMLDKVAGDFDSFVTYVSQLEQNCRSYANVSALNLLIICVRPLKYFRNDPRMAKINLTFHYALTDIAWFIVMLSFFFTGFLLFSRIMFGVYIEDFTSFTGAAVRCFQFLVGTYDFWELWGVSNWGATFFVFMFLFLFKFFFLNVFFAIIDRFFVSGEPPPFNWKRALKPAFGRLVRWVEWDDDYTLKSNDNVEKERPKSRADRVRYYHREILKIKDWDGVTGPGEGRKNKALGDVCDLDERMNEVLAWSREEGKRFVENWRKHGIGKAEFRNDDLFLRTKVKVAVDEELAVCTAAMAIAERAQRYAILVNEAMEKRDQDTLSKYILRLEDKITKKMIEKHALLIDVYHLRAESEKMRYQDPLHVSDQEKLQEEKEEALGIEDKIQNPDDADSDAEYAAAPPEALAIARGPVGAVPTIF